MLVQTIGADYRSDGRQEPASAVQLLFLGTRGTVLTLLFNDVLGDYSEALLDTTPHQQVPVHWEVSAPAPSPRTKTLTCAENVASQALAESSQEGRSPRTVPGK
jgi:hypothetical protein